MLLRSILRKRKMEKLMPQTEPTYIATIGTIFFSLIGMQDISDAAQLVFVVASTISCGMSIAVGYKQLKKKK
jgi:hypothetical protein